MDSVARETFRQKIGRVVVEHVDVAESLDGGANHGLDLFFLPKVDSNGQGLPSLSGNGLRNPFCPLRG